MPSEHVYDTVKFSSDEISLYTFNFKLYNSSQKLGITNVEGALKVTGVSVAIVD